MIVAFKWPKKTWYKRLASKRLRNLIPEYDQSPQVNALNAGFMSSWWDMVVLVNVAVNRTVFDSD